MEIPSQMQLLTALELACDDMSKGMCLKGETARCIFNGYLSRSQNYIVQRWPYSLIHTYDFGE
jgi:hypothetical protein